MAKSEDSKNKEKINPQDEALMNISLDIANIPAKDVGALSFISYNFIKTVIPYSKVSEPSYKRSCDGWTLEIWGNGNIIPYGNIPRLILTYLVTEALKTNSREIDIGKNLSQFMKTLDLPTDGKTMNRFKEQASALFGSAIKIKFQTENREINKNINIVSIYEFWWEEEENQGNFNLFSSRVILSQDFFDLIKEKNIPVDLRALKAVQRSPMAMDVYSWLTHRYSYLSTRTCIPWNALQFQFGGGYKDNKTGRFNFKKSFKETLKKIKVIYPQAKFDFDAKGLILYPSATHIPKKEKKKLKGY